MSTDRRKNYCNLIVVFLLFPATLSACTKVEKPDEQPAPMRTIPVIQVVQQTLYHEFKLPGEILPYQDVPLYPKVPGFIKWIGVDRGSIVKKGQLLCVMMAPELTAQREAAAARVKTADEQVAQSKKEATAAESRLAQEQAKLKMDDVTYQRLAQAYKIPGVISANELHIYEETAAQDRAAVQARQDEVRAAEARVKALTANVAASGQQLANTEDIRDYLKITAPYDGVITERNKHVGSFVFAPHNEDYPPMLRIKENSLLRIIVPVPEVAVAGTYPGEPINFTVAAFPGQVFTGQVARIAHSLDEKTRTEPVELNYWNPKWKLDPGMFPEVIWPMRRTKPSLFVPATAVTNNLFVPFVMKITDNRIHRVLVKQGETMGDLMEVFGDLKPGDWVALKASDDIPDGAQVKPVYPSKSEPAPSTGKKISDRI